MKIIFFGRSSLDNNGRSSGPTPSGVKWGLTEVTLGAIALAAVIVSLSYRRFLQYINSTCRFERLRHLIQILHRKAIQLESTTWSRSGSTRGCYLQIPQTPCMRGSFQSSTLLSLARRLLPKPSLSSTLATTTRNSGSSTSSWPLRESGMQQLQTCPSLLCLQHPPAHPNPTSRCPLHPMSRMSPQL